jgi:hypothetical protein
LRVGGGPARHVTQFFADAGRVHQHEHGQEGGAALRPAHEGFHGAGARGDVEGVFDHGFAFFRR